MTTTLLDLTEAVGLDDPADVACIISEHLCIDLHDDDIPQWLVDEVRDILNPAGCRTSPHLYMPAPLGGEDDSLAAGWSPWGGAEPRRRGKT